jgi:hypothetical protein
MSVVESNFRGVVHSVLSGARGHKKDPDAHEADVNHRDQHGGFEVRFNIER